jgi:hypothetical protein
MTTTLTSLALDLPFVASATDVFGPLAVELPALFSVEVEYLTNRGRWEITGYLASVGIDEADAIDRLRTWAVALGAELHLSKPYGDSDGTVRSLEATTTLPAGHLIRIWTPIAHAPTPQHATA